MITQEKYDQLLNEITLTGVDVKVRKQYTRVGNFLNLKLLKRKGLRCVITKSAVTNGQETIPFSETAYRGKFVSFFTIKDENSLTTVLQIVADTVKGQTTNTPTDDGQSIVE